MNPRDAALAIFVVAIWGLNFTVAKLALMTVPPIFLIAVRFLVIALMIAPFVRIPLQRLKGVAMLGGTLGLLHFVPMFSGIRLIDSATAAITAQLQVPFATLLAVLFLGEKPGWQRWAGMGLAFIGMIVISGEPRLGGNLFGFGLVVFAAFTWSMAQLQMKGLRSVSPLALNGWMAVFAAPILFAASAVLEHDQVASFLRSGWVGWSALAYMIGPVTLFGYGMWYGLIGRYPVSVLVPFTLLTPLFGVAGGMLVLDEQLTWPMVIGGALTLGGVAIISIRRRRTMDASS